MRKGAFFKLDSAQRCHRLGKGNAIFAGKGFVCFFYKFAKTLSLGG